MKRMALFVVAVLAVCIAVCAQKSGNSGGKKVLVAYFSATGTTEKVARQLAEATGGVLCEIRPVKEYTSADLDWRNKSSRSSVEMADSKSRPAFSADLDNPAGYDTVYIGFPIWWNLAPRIINTFMESYDFTGKTLIPFATSGGSGISNAGKDLRKTYPDMKWQEGKLLNGATEEEIKEWIKNK
ncbi:flavodoxin [uncultured Bacteroides sp.]|uniref:flavodoxin n=1 Tax=uncultured Bacteroides sp. TaxID=162156 RepID=UPI002674CC3A|nr:flavodoxin [uncultured Bacteroides sp.]